MTESASDLSTDAIDARRKALAAYRAGLGVAFCTAVGSVFPASATASCASFVGALRWVLDDGPIEEFEPPVVRLKRKELPK